MYRCGIETVKHAQNAGLSVGINCTVVELKHKIHGEFAIATSGINCTVVELKLDCPLLDCVLILVLIVPLWN